MTRALVCLLAACSQPLMQPYADAMLMVCHGTAVELDLAPCHGGYLIAELSPLLDYAQIGEGVCAGGDCTLVTWGSVVETWQYASDFTTSSGRHFHCD